MRFPEQINEIWVVLVNETCLLARAKIMQLFFYIKYETTENTCLLSCGSSFNHSTRGETIGLISGTQIFPPFYHTSTNNKISITRICFAGKRHYSNWWITLNFIHMDTNVCWFDLYWGRIYFPFAWLVHGIASHKYTAAFDIIFKFITSQQAIFNYTVVHVHSCTLI